MSLAKFKGPVCAGAIAFTAFRSHNGSVLAEHTFTTIISLCTSIKFQITQPMMSLTNFLLISVNARAQQRCVKRILKQLKIALKMALVHLLLFLRMPTGKPSHSLFVTSIGIVFRSIYQKQDQPLLTLYRDRCAVSSRLPREYWFLHYSLLVLVWNGHTNQLAVLGCSLMLSEYIDAVLRSANPEWASVGCRHEASVRCSVSLTHCPQPFAHSFFSYYMDDQQPTPISSSDSSSVPILTESSTGIIFFF